jgi:hypothetical protein
LDEQKFDELLRQHGLARYKEKVRCVIECVGKASQSQKPVAASVSDETESDRTTPKAPRKSSRD